MGEARGSRSLGRPSLSTPNGIGTRVTALKERPSRTSANESGLRSPIFQAFCSQWISMNDSVCGIVATMN